MWKFWIAWRSLWVAAVGLAAALVLAPLAWGQTVQVERPVGTVIPHGGTDGQGWQRAGEGQVVLTYTVRNTGDQPLDVTNITAGSLVNTTVGSLSPTSFSVDPNGTRTVEVRYTPATDGPFSFEVTITSNAPDYAWTVSGDGDATLPTVPVPLTPPDGAWFNTTGVGFTWEASTDDGSGVRDYRVRIFGPVNRDHYTANTYYNPVGLVEGAYSWHVRARDWVGNPSAYSPDRWFSIDLTPPVDPTLTSPSHTVGVPSNNPNVEIAATSTYDPVSGGVASGVDGFEVAWSQSATWTPTKVSNRSAGWTGETFVATSDGEWWVHVATVDVAGNWTSTRHLGPFQIDTDPPQVVSVVVDTDPMYEGDLTQQVTVTFDEVMDTSVAPVIAFSEGTFSSNGDGQWDIGQTVWWETFTLANNSEEFTGVTVSVNGARDTASNEQLPYTSGPLFDIDTNKPTVVSVTPDRLTDADVGTVYVSIEFSEPMGTTTNPSPALLDLASSPYTIVGTTWTNGDRTWTGSFLFVDDDEEAMGTYHILGFKDRAGNLMPWTTSFTVDVDTRNPRATVTTDRTTIAGGSPIYEGSLVLTVTVTYDEAMNQSTTPQVALMNAGTNWSGPHNGQWMSSTVYTAQFTHSGTEEEVLGVALARVVGGTAQDLAGNTDVGADSPVFDIDTRKPRATVTTDHTTIALAYGDPLLHPIFENSLVLTVTVTYDEDMNETSTPTIVLVGHTPARWTGPSGGWTGPRTYTATFTHDGGPDEEAGVTAQVPAGSGARDLAGNFEVGDVESPPFDVDTVKPDILLIWADEPACPGECYTSGSVCPPGAFGVSVRFSEAVWQGAGDDLLLTFNLLHNAPGGTLAFSAISPDSVTAPAVWQPQEETRTYVVQDGDNACRLAATAIWLLGNLYDVAGNAFAPPVPPLGSSHNITDNQDVNVDTSRPVIHDLRFTDATYTQTVTDYYVDDCCVTRVYFAAHVTDNCYVLTDNVHVTVTLPTQNAILENVQIELAQTALNRVDITGSAVVRCLTSCPARVEVLVEARDCRGGPACCGNWAEPQVTTTDEGLVWDTVLPIPRDDPRQDMIMDESAIVDPLVEVRRDDLGVYRLLVRENTPVRIDVLRNDADNCSCRCEAGPHPFDPCGPCSACSGCCATLFLHEIVHPPTFGTATVENETGDCAGGTIIRYAPELGFVGPDWFTYTIRDACGNVSAVIATVYLQVIPELAMEDVFVVACAGSATEFTVRATDLWIDYDPHDIPFRFRIVAGPEHGVVVGDPNEQALIAYSTEIVDGQLVPTLTFIETAEVTLVYIPVPGYTGSDEIWIRLEDPFGATQTARIALAAIDCAAEGVSLPAVAVSRGSVLSVIPPTAFTAAARETGPLPTLISLDDGGGHSHAVGTAWGETVNRPLLFLDTRQLPPGRYLLIIPLAHGERVEIVVVVKEEA